MTGLQSSRLACKGWVVERRGRPRFEQGKGEQHGSIDGDSAAAAVSRQALRTGGLHLAGQGCRLPTQKQ